MEVNLSWIAPSVQYICGSSDELLRDICRDITEYNPDWIVENTYKGIDWGSHSYNSYKT